MKPQLSWDDVVRERNRREDERVRKDFERFAWLGRGHFRTDIAPIKEEDCTKRRNRDE